MSFEPLLKWPGGKRRLLQSILPLIPTEFGTYYEPFLGGGALFFALQPHSAVLADKNRDLISTYRQIKTNPDDVISALGNLQNNERAYYTVRAWEPDTPVERAARLIYLAALSFNGIHRVNLRGAFNVPYGYKQHLKPCEPLRIREASRILNAARLKSQDFERTVRPATSGDLVYFDPPYTTTHGNNGFVKYNARIFTWKDQERLARIALQLASRGCSVLVSNADHPSIRELYRDFDVLVIKRYSIMAASGNFRRLITECVFYAA